MTGMAVLLLVRPIVRHHDRFAQSDERGEGWNADGEHLDRAREPEVGSSRASSLITRIRLMGGLRRSVWHRAAMPRLSNNWVSFRDKPWSQHRQPRQKPG